MEIKRLKQLKQLWENTARRMNWLARLSPIVEAAMPAGRHPIPWREFGDAVLKQRPGDHLDPRFVDMETWSALGLGIEACVADDLTAWNRESRRVFRLNQELQRILLLSDFGEIRLEDVLWPFDCFAIELGEPLRWSGAQDYEYDTLVVNVKPDVSSVDYLDPTTIAQRMRILLCGAPLDQIKPIPMRDVELVTRFLKKGRTADAARQLGRIPGSPKHGAGIKVVNFGHAAMTRRVEEMLGMLNDNDGTTPGTIYDENMAKTLNLAVRLIFGLAVYLDGEHVGTPPRSDGVPPEATLVGSITDADEICMVTSEGALAELSHEERTALADAIEERGFQAVADRIKPYWRRRHRRRPPGMGKDPTAAKTVKVRPHLVLGDRLPQGTLPGGLDQRLE